MTLYKCLATGRQSPYGRGVWTPSRWRTTKGELIPCRRGIHFCREDQIVSWLNAELWTFEDGALDSTIDAGDKMVTRKGRVLERVQAWDARTARLFTADCAEHVLPIFERLRPDDDRPRLAIEAARAVARGEIGAAAGAAAWAAAGAAAWAAAGAAERVWQTGRLMEHLSGLPEGQQ